MSRAFAGATQAGVNAEPSVTGAGGGLTTYAQGNSSQQGHGALRDAGGNDRYIVLAQSVGETTSGGRVVQEVPVNLAQGAATTQGSGLISDIGGTSSSRSSKVSTQAMARSAKS